MCPVTTAPNAKQLSGAGGGASMDWAILASAAVRISKSSAARSWPPDLPLFAVGSSRSLWLVEAGLGTGLEEFTAAVPSDCNKKYETGATA